MSGTTWVAPREGSTPLQLTRAARKAGLMPMKASFDVTNLIKPTSLLLTGKPLDDYDKDRIEVAINRMD